MLRRRASLLSVLAFATATLLAAATAGAPTADAQTAGTQTAGAQAARPGGTAEPRYGLSVFGNLKYPEDFTHFDYTNPDAPKGGTLRLAGIDTFETVNPYILKGRKEGLAGSLLFDTLMARAYDEPDSYYGLVAKSVEEPADKSWVAFDIDPRARFHDGTPITADDVVFTYDILVREGHPAFRILFSDVDKAVATSRLRVKFTFKPGQHRDLPTRLAALPVLSKAYYKTHKFDETTFDAPLSSGPYRVASIDPGRSIVYERVKNYWAKDLPVNRGRYNFDRIRVDYYRDRDIAFQAFFPGQYDFREDFTSRQWATQYNEPPVNDGRIVRETLPDDTPSGVQMFVLNLRRKKFQDIRVREALDLAFDFEWTNRTLFYNQYRRTSSMFENSRLAAHAPPTRAELALLEPFRGKVPPQVFTTPFEPPVARGPNGIRANLRKAAHLLREAGYSVRGGVLVNRTGRPFHIEFLLFEPSFTRVINPYIRNLGRLGIKARIRIVDIANFKRREDNFDFDVVVNRIVQRLTPGIELRNYFGSEYADTPGTYNLSGIKNPVVDALIGKVIAAQNRPALVTAVHALDRVLMWNRYVVPQWYKGRHNIAFWNKFDRPKIAPKYDLGVIDTWWYDKAKAKMLADGEAPPPPPGALPPPSRN